MMRTRWIGTLAAVFTLVVLVVAVSVAMAATCSGGCYGQTVNCQCEGDICEIDCSTPVPYCVCSCS